MPLAILLGEAQVDFGFATVVCRGQERKVAMTGGNRSMARRGRWAEAAGGLLIGMELLAPYFPYLLAGEACFTDWRRRGTIRSLLCPNRERNRSCKRNERSLLS